MARGVRRGDTSKGGAGKEKERRRRGKRTGIIERLGTGCSADVVGDVGAALRLAEVKGFNDGLTEHAHEGGGDGETLRGLRSGGAGGVEWERIPGLMVMAKMGAPLGSM